MIVIMPEDVRGMLLPLALGSIKLDFALARLQSKGFFIGLLRRVLKSVVVPMCRVFGLFFNVVTKAAMPVPVIVVKL